MSRRAGLPDLFIALSLALASGCDSPITPTPPPPTFTLTGTVMEARGEARTPARDIPVEISPTHRAVTDGGGGFSIPGLVAGTYVVHVRGPFHEPLSTVVKIEGHTRLDLEIVPLPVYAVSGAVYEDTANGPIPVPGVLVNNSAIHDSARTDENGAYRVLALRGVAQISFTKSGYVDQDHAIVMQGDVRLDVKLIRR